MKERIAITGSGSISSNGFGNEAEKNWFLPRSGITKRHSSESEYWCAPLPALAEEELKKLCRENPVYAKLDRSVLMAIVASRLAVNQAGWEKGNDFGINIASSRGTTELLESYHHTFIKHPQARLASMTSPATTSGNISSWVGQDLETEGIMFSHSITCSSSLHAVANALAWIRSGMSQRFLVGGSEAPLTPFTVAQMRGLKIYAGEQWNEFPCRPFNGIRNSMVLGEAVSVFCLEKDKGDKSALAYIAGLGYASEKVQRAGAISANGDCLQASMKMALASCGAKIDLILAHAPGTIKGDEAEMNAIVSVFGDDLPEIYSSKWQTGHTLGASGSLNMNLALAIFQKQQIPQMPFIQQKEIYSKEINRIMINAVGFGGNAVSLVLERGRG